MDALFQVRKLNSDGQAKAGSVAKAFNELLRRIRNNVAPCREMALAEMYLEQACFLVKKGIANDPENQIQEKKPAVQPTTAELLAQSIAQKKPKAKSQKPGRE